MGKIGLDVILPIGQYRVMNALQRYFHATGDSASALAARICRPASTITRIAKGERSASPQLALEISKATGEIVSPADILSITVEMIRQGSLPQRRAS